MKLIEERHKKYKELSKQNMTNKLSGKREKYEISHEKYLLSKKQEEEEREEKIFKKFEGYVSIIYYIILLIIFIYIVFHNER